MYDCIFKYKIIRNYSKTNIMDPSSFFNYCADFMETEDFKKCMRPLITMLLQEIYPYIYISILFVLVAFFLILAIFVLLVRERKIV